MHKSKKHIIGTGWSFPPAFNLQSKQIDMVEGNEDIHQSLHILFGTKPGERVLEQNFGCNINAAIFLNMTLTEKTVLENSIKEAIVQYEPRIELNGVEVDTSQALDGIIHIQIDFTVRNTNSRHNKVYPFFIGEGTLVPKDIL